MTTHATTNGGSRPTTARRRGIRRHTGDVPRPLVVALGLVVLGATAGEAQWTNRYPKNNGFNHHVYLEGYELPTLAAGALDPAIAPDGKTITLASRGWLWLLDVERGEAKRLTSSAGVDSRPAWSPDGRQLAFVRDDSRTTAVVVRDMTTGAEREVDKGMSLDPAFAPDGRALYFASVAAGDLDIWRSDLASGEKTRVTTSGAGIELRPLPLANGRVVYVSKTRGGQDEVRLRTLTSGDERTLVSGSIIAILRPGVSRDGSLMAYSWPAGDGWELRLTSIDRPGVSISLVNRPRGRPLTPAFSPDGQWIYYVESDRDQVMRLWRVATGGGAPREVPIRHWDWGAPTGRLTIRTQAEGNAPLPARLNVTDASGHPLIPERGQPRFDGQTGSVYFYSSGTIDVPVPAGRVTVRAVRGLATPERTAYIDVPAGESRDIALDLTALWNAQANGWYSGDHHFHLNYGGQFDLLPDDLVPLMQGEDLDVGTPMLANLHNRFFDQAFWRYARTPGSGTPLIRFAQEVRPHFLGHVGLIGTDELFWPWVWGPGYEVYGRDDRAAMTALDAARAQGGLGTYVHPTMNGNPFGSDAGLAAIPVGLIPDAVLGHVDLFEVACLWNDEVGASDIWYRFLNLGIPIAPEGGTDAMTDLHRTMALGSTRVYVRPDGPFNMRSYLAALRDGRSFVTNGPLLDVRIGDKQPGDAISRGGTKVPFRVRLYSAVPVDRVELVVNGAVAWSATSGMIDSSGTREYSGEVALPAGGWVAARALGPRTVRWPAMDSYAFAHTAPVWIGRRGSTDAAAERTAAADLLRALDVAEKRLVEGYAGSDIPVLRAHFQQARRELERRTSMTR